MRHNKYPVSFAFRLEQQVAERLRDVAHAHGYLPAEWARKIVSEAIDVGFARRAVRLRAQNAELLRAYLVELQRQGNNLNQIAKALNTDGRRAAAEVTPQLQSLREQQDQLMIAVLDALGASRTP